MPKYLFSYAYGNSRYSLTVEADTQQEAVARVRRMSTAVYDGELQFEIKVPTGFLQRLLARLHVKPIEGD